MMSKKERILNVIKDIRKFRFCGPSDDPDEQTGVSVGYQYLLIQLKRLATPFIPESIGKSLNSIEVEINNLSSVYEASAEIDAMLPDIELIIQGLDVSVFDAVGGKELKRGNMGFYDEEIAKAKTPLELRKAIEQELAAWYDVDMGGLHIMSDTLGTAIAIALSIRAKHINLPDVPSDINGLMNWCITCEKIMAEVGDKEMTEKRNFLEEHRDFLRKIAMSVSSLVSTSDERAYFRKQVEAFSHKVEEHQKELDEIKKDYEANSKLQEAAKKLDEQIKNDPVDEEGISDIEMTLHCTGGWGMLENFKDYIYYAGGFWGHQTQKVDFVHYLEHFPYFHPGDFGKTPNEEEKLICSFTLLSAIHDEYVKEKPIFFDKPVRFYQSQNPQHWVIKVEQRCDCFNAIFGGYFGQVKDTQAWIQRAFNDVKADLASLSQVEKKPKDKPTLQDLAKQLFDLDKAITDLVSCENSDPEHDLYDSNQVLKQIGSAKELAITLSKQFNNPQIKEALEVLTKLHRDITHIAADFDYIASPSCPDDSYSKEEAAKFVKEVKDDVEATYKNIFDKLLPGLKEKYHSTLENLAAEIEAYSLVSSAGTEQETTAGQNPKQNEKDVLIPDTKEGFADKFIAIKEAITEKLNEFAYKQDDPEVEMLRSTYFEKIRQWINLVELRFADDPLALISFPFAIGIAPYADLLSLAKFCEKAAKELMTPHKANTYPENTGTEDLAGSKQNIKLKMPHKALIKALAKVLEKGNTTEITRDALVSKTNYSVGSGNINQAYIELKKWKIITQDGQNFTPNFQHYKQNPPD